jgi:aerobic carbon-monoxide dehydrogenase medium subunit
MYDFNYHRASSVADAVSKVKGAGDGKFLAGGMTLLPTVKMRLAKPSDLVDLGGVKDLAGIKVEGGKVTIGAMTKHADVAHSEHVKRAIPALAALAEVIGDPQVRNRGTIGGSLANSDPAADYPAAVLGLGATIKTNEREIAADDFFKGLFETALKPGEMIVSISFPVPQKAAYSKFVSKGPSGARVAVTGAGPCAFRHKDMEAALGANWSAGALDAVKTAAAAFNNDIHASAEYRAHLVGVMAKRAVAAAG